MKKSMKNKKVGLISLGCAKNQVVSEQMLKKLKDAGFKIVSNQYEAEIIVINTCAFIEEAQEEAIDTILETNKLRTEGKLQKLIVTGCLAELFKEEVRKELPEVDAVLGAHSCLDIVKAIEECEAGVNPEYFAPSLKTPPEEERLISTGEHWAYLLIADGCDNGCTYCVIPRIRGRFKSRPMEKVLKEAEKLADMGYNELILVAQDLSHYGFDLYGKNSLAALLRELTKIEKLQWIRLHYIYPSEIDEELIETIANDPKILKYIDMPIQHINDEVLRLAGRKDRGDKIKSTIVLLREKIPNIVIRSSLITGLPGEDEEAFLELMDFLREYKLQRVGTFAFSPQEGTAAARMEHVSRELAERRAEVLMEEQIRIMEAWEQSLSGKTIDAKCDYVNLSGEKMGRAYFDSPGIDGSLKILGNCSEGDIIKVKIISAQSGEMIGEII